MSNAPEMSPEIGDSSLSAYADIFGVAGLITHAKIHKILILCLLQFRFCGARITWFVSRTPFFTHNILEVYLLEFLSMLLSILDTEMEVPLPYSPFHIFFVIASVWAGFLISGHAGGDGSFIRRFLLVTSLLIIVLEIYKQINYSFRVEGGRILFDYQWHAFPFQFCSTPMYIALIATVTKSEALHRRLCAYLASYSLFAGISVMAYPVSVFTDTVGINIQTMVWHGGMITMGIVLLRTGYVRASLRTVLEAFPIFLTLVAAAAMMNELAHQTGLLATDTFNMFFISPYCAPSLPVYSLIQPHVPFPVSVLIYIAGFTAAAELVLMITKLPHVHVAHRAIHIPTWRLAHGK